MHSCFASFEQLTEGDYCGGPKIRQDKGWLEKTLLIPETGNIIYKSYQVKMISYYLQGALAATRSSRWDEYLTNSDKFTLTRRSEQ